MNPFLSADNATADWRAAKLEWIVKDAEAKIAAEKLRIAAAKMQFRGTSVRSSQSCKVATFKNQTSFSTRFVKFAKLESLQCGQRSPSYWRRLERRKEERENTRERAEKHEDRLSKVDVNSAVVRFASRWCSEFNVMKRREEKKEKQRQEKERQQKERASHFSRHGILDGFPGFVQAFEDLQAEMLAKPFAEYVQQKTEEPAAKHFIGLFCSNERAVEFWWDMWDDWRDFNGVRYE
jgi:hypothetical protein